MASLTITAPCGARVRASRSSRPRGSGARRPVTLTARGRRLRRTVLVVVALMAALTFVSVAYGAASNASESPGAPTTRSVVVRSGQTLWSLAGQALPGIDPREAVSLVAGLNGLGTGAQLHPGQSLRIPLNG